MYRGVLGKKIVSRMRPEKGEVFLKNLSFATLNTQDSEKFFFSNSKETSDHYYSNKEQNT